MSFQLFRTILIFFLLLISFVIPVKTGIHLFSLPTLDSQSPIRSRTDFVGMKEEYVILHLVLFALGFLLQVYKLLISLILSFKLWFCALRYQFLAIC